MKLPRIPRIGRCREAIGGGISYICVPPMKIGPEEEDLESLVVSTKYDSLAEMLSQLVLLSSESGDRVIRPGESCIRLSDPSIQRS